MSSPNKCIDPATGKAMILGSRGWMPENENNEVSQKSKFQHDPVVSRVASDLRTNQGKLLARLTEMKKSIKRFFDEQKVSEVLDRENRTAQKNTRYLL